MKQRTISIALMAMFAFIAVAELTVSREHRAVKEVVAKAAMGNPKALYDLAILHDMGYDSIPVDSTRSTVLYRLSAEAGYPPAQNYLGFRYFNGEAIRQDVDSALYWMAKAAGNGDTKAANNLGYLLANSDKVSRDYPQALYWLSKAAEAGLPAGASQLADLYRQGLGCQPDTARAESLYVKAIQSGLRDAELKLLAMKGKAWETLPADSMLSLGKYHYTHGAPIIGVTLFVDIIKSNENKGRINENEFSGKEMAVSAEKDNVLAKAYALLGDAFSRGIGVEYNHEGSIQLFLQAALLGEPSAQFVIAELLDIFPDALSSIPDVSEDSIAELSTIVPALRDLDEKNKTAAYWYEQAAAKGITDAATATSRLLE